MTRDVIRKAAATVRLPGERIAPMTKGTDFAKVGAVKATAKIASNCIISSDRVGISAPVAGKSLSLIPYHKAACAALSF